MTNRTTRKTERRTNGHSPEAPPAPLIKLDLGCGQRKQEGFVGVDVSAECAADVVHDLTVVPWPFDDNSVEEVVCSHFVEHLTGAQRIAFMDELWRVLVPGGRATIVTPYAFSVRAMQDPTHQWPPLVDQSYLYFYAWWRRANGLDHYPIRADFDFVTSYILDTSTGVLQWNEERRGFAMRHHNNIISDLQAVLIKHDLGCERTPEHNVCTCAALSRLPNGRP